MSILESVDPEVAKAINSELNRQRNSLELIASENFTSLAVLIVQGSVLTNKYAEGYPDKRYYGGCQFVDEVERLAYDRAKQLFSAEHANVQPHSGSQANMAAYLALLDLGDTVLGLDLSHGGHLTHGSKVNFSGMLYNFVPYGVNPSNEQIDYEQVRELALKHKPKMILTGASAYPRIIDFKTFREIADEIGAYLIVDMAHTAGLVAGGVYPNPVSYAEAVTTTTHKTLRGPRAGLILCQQKFAEVIDKMIFPGIQGGPLMHVIAAKAVALREAQKPEFKEYQKQVVSNAKKLGEVLKSKGFRLVSGGTDTALLLVDLTNKEITGKDAQLTLDEVGITVNKNTIPFETRSPVVTSGIRIGTAALTTRGMKEPEMEIVGGLIAERLENIGDETVYSKVKDKVSELCKEFELYPELQGE